MRIRRKAGEPMEAIEWTGENLRAVSEFFGFNFDAAIGSGPPMLRVGLTDYAMPGAMIAKHSAGGWSVLRPGTWEEV